MADRLEDLLRSCMVRVTNGDTVSGTGFFVAQSTVITCAHVAGTASPLTVHWERDSHSSASFAVSGVLHLADRGRPIPALACDYPDIAVLTVAGVSDHPCVAIDTAWPGSADVFQSFGFPSEGGAVLLTPTRLTYRGPRGTWPTLFLDLGWDTVRRGMSGAPVLNLRTGGVCGVLVASRDPQQPVGALAVPWSAIEIDLGDVMDANAAYHRTDARWSALRRQLADRPTASEGRYSPSAASLAPGIAGGAAGWATGGRYGASNSGAAYSNDHDSRHGHGDHDDDHHDYDAPSDDLDNAFSGTNGADDSELDDFSDDNAADSDETDDDDLW